MEQSRNSPFHDAPQREVLAAVNEHPVVDGISEEIGTEAYQEYHNNAAESRAYNTACIHKVITSLFPTIGMHYKELFI